jgi:hypothetical protein
VKTTRTRDKRRCGRFCWTGGYNIVLHGIGNIFFLAFHLVPLTDCKAECPPISNSCTVGRVDLRAGILLSDNTAAFRQP